MTPGRVAEIKSRCAAATCGPWAWENTGDKGGNGFVVGLACTEDGTPLNGKLPETEFVVDDIIRGDVIGGVEASTVNHDDANFIAHARTDLPDAIARIEHLEAALRAVMERKGPYSQNPLKHAENTIWNMADLARRGLEGEELE